MSNIDWLSRAREHPQKGFLAIIGGIGLGDKLPVIGALLDKAGTILVGGQVAYTFLVAGGVDVGHSKVEADFLPRCRELIKKAAEKNVRLLLPIDHIAAVKVEPQVTIKMIKEGESIPDNMIGLDIGFETIKLFAGEAVKAGLILWYGPLGVWEIDTFSAGTSELLKTIAQSDVPAVITGEKLLLAAQKAGLADRFSYTERQSRVVLETILGKK